MRLLALDTELVFTTYSKIARQAGPEPARGAFRVAIGVPCVTPPSRRPSATEPSAHGSGREKKLRGAGAAAVGRVPRPRLRAGDAGAMRLVDARADASRRRACPMRAHFHGATTKRRRRRRAGHQVRAVRGPIALTRRQAESSSILEHVKELSFHQTRAAFACAGFRGAGWAAPSGGAISREKATRRRRR